MDYLLLKAVHQTAVALSIGGFFVRGLGALTGAAWVAARPARTLPHIVDSVLLLSALALAWTLGVTPVGSPWLAAKIVGLVVYILLGVVALHPTRPLALRVAAWLGALITFAWIASVAISKQVLGFFAWM